MKRLLFIAHRVPYPPDKGERVRALHEIMALAAPFRVTVAYLAHGPADPKAAEGLAPWCEKVLVAPAGGPRGLIRAGLWLLGGRSATEGYFRSPRLHRALRDEAARDPFDVAVGYSSSTLPYLLAARARARVLDLIDADSAKWDAYAAAAHWPKSRLYGLEADRVRALERQALRRCDAVTLVSRAEAQVLGREGDRVLAVGNGVDAEYFRPARPAAPPGPSLVFTGTMDYRPNADGVSWFVREVWPALRREVPGITFTIVGRDPTPAVRRLAEAPGVMVTGGVPDVRPYLAEATLAVVPLLTARGIQNKVLEAMAMGRAVVGSSGALEGLDVDVGGDVCRADTPDEWRKAVAELLADTPRRVAMERSARACVLARYSWAARMKPLVDLCVGLASAPAAEAGARREEAGPAPAPGSVAQA